VRIALIAAGSGSRFYCENCAEDGSLARALRGRGHQVASASLYLPAGGAANGAAGGGANGAAGGASDGAADRVSADGPLFFGAVGMFLTHRFPFLRSAPTWFLRALDAPPLLSLAGRLSGSTRPARLEALTLSMLRGNEGSHSASLDGLLRWLETFRPDVVHLANGLLMGVAGPIRRTLGVPVTCTLQDEDTWIDLLEIQAQAWEILRERAADVALFTPVSSSFSRLMAKRLGLANDRFMVVSPGIDIDPFKGPMTHVDPPVIGYLSRISEAMGAGLLADAFILLAQEKRFPGMSLRLMGGSTASDAPLVRSLRRRLSRAGLRDCLEIETGFSPRARARFLAGVSVLSVPVLRGEAFGTFMLESMAAGVPVVQPRLRGFAEVVEDTGGGILYEPNTAAALAEALGRLLADPKCSRALGWAGRHAVHERYTTARSAAGLEAAFERARQSARNTA
jgi:glycosyltransferase involved in cell wall biosynthesis